VSATGDWLRKRGAPLLADWLLYRDSGGGIHEGRRLANSPDSANGNLQRPSEDHRRLPPMERDAQRSQWNDDLTSHLTTYDGITSAFVLQLEDHSDRGYVLHVGFDGVAAAEVLTIIREGFLMVAPDVPTWGQLIDESDSGIDFGYTYIDASNGLFRPGRTTD
jgi:hypothetical protein